MEIALHSSLGSIPEDQWDRLNAGHNPFLRHAFLYALETQGCLGQEWGWYPQHLSVYEAGQLIAAMPLYLKTNSYGEFVFDWNWAEAYERMGRPYYPKLVSAIPYTPITGQRLMLAPGTERAPLTKTVANWLQDHARRQNISTLHCLFPSQEELEAWEGAACYRRTDCQFHWHNDQYPDFDAFLATLTAEKRKKIKRERRRVRDAHIAIEVLAGMDVSDAQWACFHQFYCDTFDRRGGYPTLTLSFFQEIGRLMGDQIVLVLASHNQQVVAGALSFCSDHALYGRHWGCNADYHSLHFELCYYQGIEYCIQRGLSTFEPGAQGEHKISRGFVPTMTYSAHWFADPMFEKIISRYLLQERQGVQSYIHELSGHTPYKKTSPGAGPGSQRGV